MTTFSRAFLNGSSAILIAAAGLIVSASSAFASSAAACLSLSSDLAYGAHGAQVSTLQTFLVVQGYLSASPNGHFGPSTRAAVKALQAAHGIPATGTVGPKTRAAIVSMQARVCASATADSSSITVINPTTSAPVIATSPAAPVSPSVAGSITAPATGQVFAIGSSTMIKWSGVPSAIYNILLEQPGGAGAGFVAMSISSDANGGQYLWKVGKAFSSQFNNDQTVAPGAYRLRLQAPSSGAASSDPVSGWFTIVAPQLLASSVSPSSVPADGATSAVLLGSGFSSGTVVYFDSHNSGSRATNQYVSPDGTVLIFTVPASISAGPHQLFVSDSSNSTAAPVPFSVSAVQ